ncbi:UNVERIFIED_CONTAM: hypothetical protein GTU68_034462, partial [Idotea baltica]|nr:hypothetical protein [Idotea baltica]
MDNLDRLSEAMHKDFRKPKAEVIIGEIFAVKTEAKYAMKELSSWMKPKKVSMPLTLLGTASYIRHEPKGNVLIISPWNYPFNLAIAPLISAIAAGNACMVKPSEMAPNTSEFIRQMIADLFEPKEVTVFEGDYTIAQELLALPFNHIFFTGSPAVGKIVMRAAAEHLASVTLELGGKSPVVVDETANVKDAAEKIVWGKCLNNGQTCIAPDYAVIHHSIKDKFIEAYQEVVNKMYYKDGDIEQSNSYCRIVNRRHFDRIKGLMDDAIENGATVEMGGKTNAEDNFIEPTLLTDVTTDMRVMKEEIFGPVLPIM